MEDLWKQHPLSRQVAQQQQQQPQQLAFATQEGGAAQFNHHPLLTQEVCVIERTIRQETVGANVINFGLQATQKQAAEQNNQLLALVQQQPRQQPEMAAHLGSHFQFNPVAFQVPYANRSLGDPQAEAPPTLVGREPRNATADFPDAVKSSMTPETVQRFPDQRFTALNFSQQHSFPAAASGPRVCTLGVSGTKTGELLLTETGRLEIVCSCHAMRMPVSEFVQHAGVQSLNPGSAVFLENGDTLVQWRRAVFSQLAVKVPDDEVGWDWTDQIAPDAVGTKVKTNTEGLKENSVTEPNASFLAKSRQWDNATPLQPFQAFQFPANVVYSSSLDTVISGGNRQVPQNLFRSSKVISATSFKPTEYVSTIDFINRGGQAYGCSFEQQLAAQGKTSYNDPSRRLVQDNARQETDSLVSSFELRLGQPSQPAQAASALGSQIHRAYQKTLEAGYQQMQSPYAPSYMQHRFQGFTGQPSVQFGQQRLNVTSAEQHCAPEQTKIWTDSSQPAKLGSFNQDMSRMHSEHEVGLIGNQFRPPATEALQKSANCRPLDPVLSTAGTSFACPVSLGQQYVSQERSWTQRSQQRDVTGMSGAKEHHGDVMRPPAETYCATIGGTTGGFIQQTHTMDFGCQTAHRLKEQTMNTSCLRRSPTKTNVDPLEVHETRGRGCVPTGYGEQPLGEKEEHSRPLGTATQGPLVSGGDKQTEMAIRAGSDKNLSSSAWKTTTSGCWVPETPIVLEPVEKAPKPVDAKENPSVSKELQSDVCSKSSGNALTDFPDANQEESTLACASKEHHAVDEGSGIGKCSSSDQLSGDKKVDSSASGKRFSIRKIRKTSSTEATESEEIEIRGNIGVCRRKAMKWKRLNAPLQSKDSEGPSSGVTESRATDRAPAKGTERSALSLKRRSTTHWGTKTISVLKERRTSTVAGPELRSRDKRSKLEGNSKGSTDEGAPSCSPRTPEFGKCPGATRRPGSAKMVSLKAILKLPELQARTRVPKENRVADLSPKDGGEENAPPRESKKRKLSELSNEGKNQTHVSSKRPFKPGSAFVPRAERSPREVSKKPSHIWLRSRALHLDSIGHSPPSEECCNDEVVHPLEGTTNATAHRRKHNDLPLRRRPREKKPVAGSEIKEAGEPPSCGDSPPKYRKSSGKRHLPDERKASDMCFVCVSSVSDASNQLVSCCNCPVKVHQACYGVPKVPKGPWACRACKSNAANIACVLCGYGGGAMTRAQKTRTVVKSLLKAWGRDGRIHPRGSAASLQLRRSLRSGKAEERVDTDNTITSGVRDPSVGQWLHMVCALWMPGTRCLNVETMGTFDVSGVAMARTKLTCSICKREGGSCIQCHEANCAVPFHAWCAHSKGLLHIETVSDSTGHVRFHGRCTAHSNGSQK